MVRFIRVIFVIVIFWSSTVWSQNSLEKVRMELVNELKGEIKDSCWKIEFADKIIVLQFREVFFANAPISPLHNRNGIYNKLDTLFIKIRLEENWSVSRMDSLAKSNKSLLEPLIEKYIVYQDSVKWKNIKSNKILFMERPYSDLKTGAGCPCLKKKHSGIFKGFPIEL